MQDKIAVRELYEDWAIDNPHYEFFFNGLKIRAVDYELGGYFLRINQVYSICVNAPNYLVEKRPKTAHPTELQDPSDLDATLPIDPRETAQRDHDEIQRLLAENARLIHFIKIAIDVSPLHSFGAYSEIERESVFNQMIELGANAELLLRELDQ